MQYKVVNTAGSRRHCRTTIDNPAVHCGYHVRLLLLQESLYVVLHLLKQGKLPRENLSIDLEGL